MESQNVEYKQSWKDEYLKWICGFANAQGGTLYVGIDDNGNVVGIQDAKKLPRRHAKQMRVWDDYVEIWNEGELPIGYTPDTLMKKHSSRPRNKNIANAFYLAGFIEAWGRGFEIVADTFRKEELEVPTFKEEFSGLTVTIKREIFAAIQSGGRIDDRTGRIVKNDDSKKEDDDGNVVSDVVSLSQVHLTERQKKICEIIENNPFVSSKQMSQVLSVDPRTVQRDLAAMQKKGVLIREGNTSAGRWVINR